VKKGRQLRRYRRRSVWKTKHVETNTIQR